MQSFDPIQSLSSTFSKLFDDPDEISEKQYANIMFGDPSPSALIQYLVLVPYIFRDQNNNFKPQKQQFYTIHDMMSVQQLKSLWFKNNQNLLNSYKQANQQKNQKYTEINQKTYILLWDGKFPIKDQWTILDLKTHVGIERLVGQVNINVYYYIDCPFRLDENAFNYNDFQQKYQGKIEVPIKIINLINQIPYYFYIELQLRATFEDLSEKINHQLTKNNSVINYDSKLGYLLKIYYEKQQTFYDMISKQSKQSRQTYIKSFRSRYFDLSNFMHNKIRYILKPEQIIYLELIKPSKIILKKNNESPYLQSISISYYDKNKSSQTINNKKIVKKFSEIKDLKVSTLLKQLNLQDSLTTSICYEDLIIKPFQKISKLTLKLKPNKNEQIQVYFIPENFLYYKQITYLSKKNVKFNDIILRLTQSQKIIKYNDQQRLQHAKNKTMSRLKDNQYKNNQFLDPLLLYTSNYLHSNLNKFLRETSVSRFQTKNLIDRWEYPFCEQLIQSLLKIANYQGIVYRGSGGFSFDWKVGDIVEWNSFTSTSKMRHVAYQFAKLAQSSPYMFEIQIFSGKQIGQFSFFRKQYEVILLPYIKFKVLEVKQITQKQLGHQPFTYQYVKLKQLPIPKKIPGNIVVWIDGNIYENSVTFNEIVRKYFLKQFDLVQLVSNQHFKQWLYEYKDILGCKDVKIHFVTNLNRTIQRNGQGIDTYRMIKKISQNFKVVFYVSNKIRTLQKLKQQGIVQNDRCFVIQKKKVFEKTFMKQFVGETNITKIDISSDLIQQPNGFNLCTSQKNNCAIC